MKKLFFFSLMLSGSVFLKAQSLDDIGKLMEKNQYAPAKTGIDKYLLDPKNATNGEPWYYKGRIYNSLSRDAATSATDSYNYKLAAFEAFQKNQQLDKLDMRMKSELYKSYLDIYLGFYDLGAKSFNEKDFKAAYNSFAKAQDIENFILAKNYTYDEIKLSKLDTALVMNIAASAVQAGDTTNALINYRKIVDANVTGADYERIYEFLASYYLMHNDDVNAQNILTKAKAAYPTNNYWTALELEKLSKGGDKKNLFAMYDEIYTKDPKNYETSYNYAVELYNSFWADDTKKGDTALYPRLTTVLKSTIEVDKGIDATMLLANHLFNMGAEYSTRAALITEGKATKPDDLKKKKELSNAAIAKMDEMIPYAEKAIAFFGSKPTLTTKQKINYQMVAGYLGDAYRVKLNPKKTAEYEKIRDSIKF